MIIPYHTARLTGVLILLGTASAQEASFVDAAPNEMCLKYDAASEAHGPGAVFTDLTGDGFPIST